MSHEYLKTPEGRSQARQEHQAALEPLRRQKQDAEQQLAELANNNADNLAKRAELANNKAQKKRIGTILLIVGFICLVIASYVVNPGILEVLFDIVGLCIIAGGIYFFICLRKFKKPQAEINESLSDYDEKSLIIQNGIDSIQEQIEQHKSSIEEIEDRERNQEFWAIADQIEVGYAVVYVTSEVHFSENTPRKPQARKYDSFTLKQARIFVDGMLATAIERKYDRCLGFVKLNDTGAQGVQVVINYEMTSRLPYEWTSNPYRVHSNDWTNIFWFHVSSCRNGTTVFPTIYDTLDTFLKDTGITRKEFVDKFNQAKL